VVVVVVVVVVVARLMTLGGVHVELMQASMQYVCAYLKAPPKHGSGRGKIPSRKRVLKLA
jgi:hypothetical protein